MVEVDFFDDCGDVFEDELGVVELGFGGVVGSFLSVEVI